MGSVRPARFRRSDRSRRTAVLRLSSRRRPGPESARDHRDEDLDPAAFSSPSRDRPRRHRLEVDRGDAAAFPTDDAACERGRAPRKQRAKRTDKPDSVSTRSPVKAPASRQSFLWAVPRGTARAVYPHARRAGSSRAYLTLLRVEIARFTRTESARLCCSDPRLTAGRRYLLRCSVESGLSSADRTAATVWFASRRHSRAAIDSARRPARCASRGRHAGDPMNDIQPAATLEARHRSSDAAPLATRTGARILVDQLLVHGVERIFCVPGESYLAVLDALVDVGDRIRLVVNRHESGSAFMAAAEGTAHRPARRRVRHARTRRLQRVDRPARGVPGLDAADPVHRPGRQRLRRARGVPGGRLSPHVRPDREVGRADRPRGPRARVRRPRVRDRDQRPAGAGRARVAGGHAGRRSRRRGRAAVPRGAAVAGTGRSAHGSRRCSTRRRGRS